MANANRYVGKDLKVYWNSTSNVISGDHTGLTVNETQDSAEKTAGDESVKTYIPTQTDVTFTLSIYDTAENGAAGTLLYSGAQGTLIYAPAGTADGKPAYQIPVFVSGVNMPVNFRETVMREISFQANGQWTANWNSMASVWNGGTINP